LSSTQLHLTASEFSKVQVAKGFGDLGVWSEEINTLKHGVTVADFQNVDLPQNRTRFGLLEKKKADIRKMMSYLEPKQEHLFKQC
jgi:site-specific DNA-cytosine methylase